MRTVLLLFLGLAILAPLTLAADEEAGILSVYPEVVVGDPGAVDAVAYAHDDCVGLGLPGTAPLHPTHTTRINGFIIDVGRPITVGVAGLTPFGNGICPTAFPGPVLPQDFVGRFHLTAICRGTLNDGALFMEWTVNFAGVPMGQSFLPGVCQGYANSAFSLDVTIELTPNVVAGVPLGPLGGVRHTLAQP